MFFVFVAKQPFFFSFNIELVSLEELNMSGNMVEKLPDEIGFCSNLEVLDLNGCFLTSLPNDLTYSTRIMELNLVKNKKKNKIKN